MELSPVQLRILGCLVEKQRTTPDNYPLSTNALVNACNQTSNRDPVVRYDERTVDAAVLELRTEGLARTVTGGRANKHRHVLDEAWGVDEGELALLAVLFLRGPQTVGELRGRTERMHEFDDLDAVERTLEGLASRGEPMVRQLDRRPGQKERRWAHLLGDGQLDDDGAAEGAGGAFESATELGHGTAEEGHGSTARISATPEAPRGGEPGDRTVGVSGQTELAAEVARLRLEVDQLRGQLAGLYELLGETPPAP